MIELLNKIKIHGLIWIIAYFIPVHWEQDRKLKNGGFDILSLKSDKSYFTGTIAQHKKEFGF